MAPNLLASIEARTPLLAAMLNAMDRSIIVGVTDGTGRIVYANSSFCEISGYCADELQGQNHRILNSGAHPRSFWTQMYATIAEGGVWRSEVCNRNKSGDLYWVDTAICAIRDTSSRITHILSVRVDITARKKAEAEAQKNLARFELMVAASRAGLWDAAVTPTDPLHPSRPWYWSDQVRSLLGVSSQEFGNTLGALLDRVHPDDLDGLQSALRQHLKHQCPVDINFRIRHASGQWQWFNSRAQAVWNKNGQPIHISGSLEDVHHHIEALKERARTNERLKAAKARLEERASLLSARSLELERARAEAEAACRAKSDFLANMSHEIRTPMTAITGFAEILDDPAITPAARADAVESIRRNSAHLLTIINDILDFSKIEAGRMTIESIAVDPVQVAREVVSLLEKRALAKRVDLYIEAPVESPRIRSDPVRLRQILLNLVGNAIKFTEQGSINLQIEPYPDADAMLTIRVRDTGIGITSEHMARLFQPFTQADSSSTRRFGGTGLGLSISKHLAELLGGTLTAESTPGFGSTFTLSIRTAIEPAAEPLAPSNSSPIARTIDLSGARILVVDDSPDNRRLFSFILERAGAEVRQAVGGEDGYESALRAAREGSPFSLILMDSQMPGCDGPTAIIRLRAAGYARPIVAFTADCLTDERQRCLEAGADAFAVKPIPVPELLALCKRMIDTNNNSLPAAA